MGAGPSGIPGAIRRRPFIFLLGILMMLSATLLLYYRSSLGFMLDDWAFVIYRDQGGVDDFLNPHNEHISVLPVAIYKLFLAAFGMNAMPLHILSVFVFALSVFVLFLYLRPLAGEPAAVIGCAVILFLGTAWEDLLWAFQIGFTISIAAGLGALILLRRNDSKGDRFAGLLLCVAMISSSMGIPFLVGAGVELVMSRDRLAKRVWLLALPLVLYAAWWLGWGHTASNGLSLANAIDSPRYVFESFRNSVGAVTGAFKVGGGKSIYVTRLAGVILLAAIGVYLYRNKKLPRPFLIAVAVALAFWGLAALNQIPGRSFDASRYQYPGAVFLLMILAGAIDGARVDRRVLAAMSMVAVFAIYANLSVMSSGYDIFKSLSDKGTAGLTALEIARETVPPGRLVGMNADDSAVIDSESYFAAEEKYGTQAWNEGEIEDASEEAKARVDNILIISLPITGKIRSTPLTSDKCVSTTAAAEGGRAVPVPSATFAVRPRENVFIQMGRYAEDPTLTLLPGQAGKTSVLRVPPDRSSQPWQVAFQGVGKVLVCPVIKQG